MSKRSFDGSDDNSKKLPKTEHSKKGAGAQIKSEKPNHSKKGGAKIKSENFEDEVRRGDEIDDAEQTLTLNLLFQIKR